MFTFGELIKNHRKQNKLTQTEFGKLINKTQASISDYEKGVHYPNDAEELDMIAQVLDQSVSQIVTAIKYSKNGFVEENKELPIELDKVDVREHFKFLVDGEEVMNEELDKMLYIVRFERFIRKQ